MRELAIPIMHREIRNPAFSSEAIQKAGQILSANHLQPQLHKREDRTSFFLMEDHQRIPVHLTENGFETQAGTHYSEQELIGRLNEAPQQFSPSAILRPVLQDAILPVAAAILGPGELAYHFLLKDIYEQHQIPRPALVPRFGFTILEGKDQKSLKRYSLLPAELQEDSAALVRKLTRREHTPLIEQEKEKTKSSLEHFFRQLSDQAKEVDPTIESVLQKNLNRLLQELDKSEQLLIRRQADKNERMRQQIESLQNALLPEGDLQERHFTIYYYLLKYGHQFMAELKSNARQCQPGKHYFMNV